MLFKNLKDLFKKKFTICFLTISTLILLIIYIMIKNEFFYSAVNYFFSYLDYYVSKYLLGNVNDLIVDNKIFLFLEEDLQNIYSSLYIYAIFFSSVIYKIYSFILPLVIFWKISSNLYCEVYKNNAIPKITRMGINRYLNNTIISNSIYIGLLVVIPKILYLIILSWFFKDNISSIHYVSSASFVLFPYLFSSYKINAICLILLDFLMTFLYGIVVSLISIVVSSISKNKGLSYIIYFFIIGGLSIIPLMLLHSPLIYYSSIFLYFEQVIVDESIIINVFSPVLILLFFIILLLPVTRIILKKKVQDNI